MELSTNWVMLIWTLAAAGSMVVGSLGALNQRSLKRLLAFSTIGHVGYALVGLSVGTREGFQGFLFTWCIYAVMSLGAFALLLGYRVRFFGDPQAGVESQHPMLLTSQGILGSDGGHLATSEAQRRARAWHETWVWGKPLADSRTPRLWGQSSESTVESVIGMSGSNVPTPSLGNQVGSEGVALGQWQPVRSVHDLAGLGRTHPALGFAWTVVLFALAGIPPFAGFWSKYVVFSAALGSEAVFLAVLAIVTSVIAAFYYIRLVKTLYFPTAAEETPLTVKGLSLFDPMSARVCALVVLVLTVFTFDPSGPLAFLDLCLQSLLA